MATPSSAAVTPARVVTFGRAADADVRAADVTVDEAGRAGFTLVTAAGSAPVQLRLHGEHHVSNALAAAALAAELGMTTDAIAAGLSAAEARSRWRMEVTRRPDGVTIVNDAYNAVPEGVRAALATLSAMTGGGRRHRGFAVLGYMTELGDQAEEFLEEAKSYLGMGQYEGLKRYRILKKDRARMLTILNEKRAGGEVPQITAPVAAKAAGKTKAGKKSK